MAGMAGQRAGVTENNLGQSFLAEEQIETALTHFTRATLQAPSDHVFDNNRRLALLLQQEYVAAIRGLPADKASALLGDAGIIAARHGDKKLAIYLFEKAQALSPRYNAKLAAHIERTQN
jgi:Flp pilus assembly protein TadD